MLPDKTTLLENSIAKQLNGLLPQIDTNVSWVDYIPGEFLCTQKSLIVIGMKDGKVKYVDIHKKDPFHLVGTVLDAMDDYCLAVQYLNARQVAEIEDDLTALANRRMKVTQEALEKLKSLDEREKAEIVLEAIKYHIFPDLFPKKGQNIKALAPLIAAFMVTNSITFTDTRILSSLITERYERNQTKEFEHDIAAYG